MARFTEIMESRVGRSVGLNPGNDHVTVRVVADSTEWIAGPDGKRTPPDPLVLVQTQYAPFGSRFPTDANLYAVGWDHVRHEAPGQDIVRIRYVRSAALATPANTDKWQIEVRSASISDTIIEELPDTTGRLRAAEPPDSGIGPSIFVPVAGDHPDAKFFASVNILDGRQQIVYLKKTGERAPDRAQVDLPAMSVVFTRLQPNFELNVLGQAAQYFKAVNSRKWRGADPGHVMLDSLTVSPIEAVIPGQNEPNVGWRVSVSFLWSAKAFTPLRRVPMWIDEAGSQHIVFDRATSQKVVEERRIKPMVDFDQFFALLDGAGGGRLRR